MPGICANCALSKARSALACCQLFGKTFELGVENGRLPIAHAVVAALHRFKGGGIGLWPHAATVAQRVKPLIEAVAVSHDKATLACI